MSVAGILEAMRSPRPLAERLVWQCLENHANGARFWPMSEEAIAKELSLGLNTVSRAVQALVAANIVRAERHKRRPTVFYMLREYGKPNGQHAPHEEELTPQNDGSSEHLTTQNGDPTPELTTQNGGSSHPHQLELTPQDGVTSPELTPQNGGTSYPPVKNPPERKKEHPKPLASEGRHFDAPRFDEFWQLYPRKVGKRTAEAAFNAAVNRGNDPAAIVDGLRGYTFDANPQFQPHPTTWLRGDRWLDEVDSFDPVLRAAGLRPEDFLDAPPGGLLQ